MISFKKKKKKTALLALPLTRKIATAQCTIASKIFVTPKGVFLLISKLHSILAVANLLAHNNVSQICYCGQISLQSAAVNCSFSENLTPFWGNIYFAGYGTCIIH